MTWKWFWVRGGTIKLKMLWFSCITLDLPSHGEEDQKYHGKISLHHHTSEEKLVVSFDLTSPTSPYDIQFTNDQGTKLKAVRSQPGRPTEILQFSQLFHKNMKYWSRLWHRSFAHLSTAHCFYFNLSFMMNDNPQWQEALISLSHSQTHGELYGACHFRL